MAALPVRLSTLTPDDAFLAVISARAGYKRSTLERYTREGVYVDQTLISQLKRWNDR